MFVSGLPPGLLDLLNVSSGSLAAHQAGLGTVAHNVANASTPGFSRRDLDLSPLDPLRGVDALRARRATDNNLLRQIVEQSGRQAFAQAREPWLSEIEAALGDLDDTGLGASLDAMFASFRTLAASPDDPATRQDTLMRASDLAAQVRRAATDLGDLMDMADRRIRDELPGINDSLREVARLNRDIRIAEGSGGDAGDLRDLRDQALRTLAEKIGARALHDSKDGVIVLVGGIRLVQDDLAEKLVATPDPATGRVRVEIAGPPGSDLTGTVGGVLGAHVEVRDGQIPDRLTSLDQLAWDLAASINARHAAGFGLDGVSGRNLFAAPAGVAGAAANMTLDAAVLADTDALATALDPAALPGDGRNALEMADLEDQDLALLGTATLSQALGALQAEAGQHARDATLQGEREADRTEQLDALRQSMSGVDVQEQLLLMGRYQRAYQASAQVLATLDEMLETLVNLR